MVLSAPLLLVLLLLVPLLIWLFVRAERGRRSALGRLVAAGLQGRLVRGRERRNPWLRAGLPIGAVACLVLALAGPRWGRGPEDVPRVGRDIVVMLDVSLSMLAADAAPNRLARAKAAVRDLVETMRREGGHRLGLVTFAGRASWQSPPTLDYALFLERLDDAGPHSVTRRGSLVGDALRQTIEGSGRLEPGYTDILLLTDGEDHDSLPLEAARAAARHEIAIYTVGIGDPTDGAPVPEIGPQGQRRSVVFQGREVRSRMQPTLLLEMARLAKGDFLPAGTGGIELSRFYEAEIAGKPRRLIELRRIETVVHRYHWFVLLALALLAADMLIGARWPGFGRRGLGSLAGLGRLRLGAPARAAVVLAALVLLPAAAEAPSPYDAVDEGNAHYEAERFQEAAEAYERALQALPDEPRVLFDLGDAFYGQRRYNEALEHYTKALQAGTPELEAKLKYNLGLVKYQQAIESVQTFQNALMHLEAAMSYFRSVLDLEPDHADARYNLELSLFLQDRIRQQQVTAQANPELRNQATSPNQGQSSDQEQGQADDQGEMAAGEAQRQQQSPAQGRQPEKADERDAKTDKGPQKQQGEVEEEISAEEAEQMLDILRDQARVSQEARRQLRAAYSRDTMLEKFW